MAVIRNNKKFFSNDRFGLNVLKTPNEGYAVVDAELRFTGIMQEDSIGNSVETFTT